MNRSSATTPPGWPEGVPPPEAQGWQDDAVGWLLDAAPAHYRLDPFLPHQPHVLARLVVEHLHANVTAARQAPIPLQQWERAGPPPGRTPPSWRWSATPARSSPHACTPPS